MPIRYTDILRPKDIPPIVPDCGWNHGEPVKERKKISTDIRSRYQHDKFPYIREDKKSLHGLIKNLFGGVL